MKHNILLFLVTTVLFSCKKENSTSNAVALKVVEQPNFLFILVDDLGVKDLGYLGSTFHETPHIDSLASKSFNFTQGYAGSRVCSPSRATIMTGKFTARHGITDWIGAKTGRAWRNHKRHDKLLPANYIKQLQHNEITLAEALKANSYNTFFAGKWHLGNTLPTEHGFNINKGGWDKGSPKGGYFSPFKNPYLKDSIKGENLSMRLANETIKFVKQNKEQPFFAFLSFYAVHSPIQTTEKKWNKYRQKALDNGIVDKGFMMERKLPIRQTQDNPVYGGLVESVDDAIGKVIQELKATGQDKNTIIVFTSDNGGVASGDNFSTSNLPFKGGKGYQWEGGIREPYLIYIPWKNSSKRQINYPVTGADFYPTILDYANINLIKKQHQDGISLKPIIEIGEIPEKRPLYWHYPHYGNQGGDPSSIIREGEWKLVYYYETDTNELYNLDDDPYEKHDLAKLESEKTLALNKKLMQWLNSVDASFPTIDSNFNINKRRIRDSLIKYEKLPNLEKQRLNILQENYKPNKNWWQSQQTKD